MPQRLVRLNTYKDSPPWDFPIKMQLQSSPVNGKDRDASSSSSYISQQIIYTCSRIHELQKVQKKINMQNSLYVEDQLKERSKHLSVKKVLSFLD